MLSAGPVFAQGGGCDAGSINVPNAPAETDSTRECLREAISKCQIFSAVQQQCKWSLPTLTPDGKEGSAIGDQQCSAYREGQDGRRYKRQSTHDGVITHAGVLSCENSKGAIMTSHVKSQPMISYECEICETSEDSAQLNSKCSQEIFVADVQRCKRGEAAMRCRHDIGKTTCTDANGNQTVVQ